MISPAALEVLAWVGEDPAARRIAADVLRVAAKHTMFLDPCNVGDKIAQDYWDAGFACAIEEMKVGLLGVATELEGSHDH